MFYPRILVKNVAVCWPVLLTTAGTWVMWGSISFFRRSAFEELHYTSMWNRIERGRTKTSQRGGAEQLSHVVEAFRKHLWWKGVLQFPHTWQFFWSWDLGFLFATCDEFHQGSGHEGLEEGEEGGGSNENIRKEAGPLCQLLLLICTPIYKIV